MMNGPDGNYGFQRKDLLSESSKNLIYQEWIIAGKPHNIICSQCFKLGNMIPCATCCRSYHAVCLTVVPSVEETASWPCPACQERQRAVNFPLPLAGSTMMASSPASRSVFSDAKKFIADHGCSDRDVDSVFLKDLQQLITQAQLASQKETELARLRTENSQLMEEIRRLKADSKSPHSGQSQSQSQSQSPSHGLQHGPTSPQNHLSGTPKLSRLDVSEKSWDRIISEAF